MTELNERMKKLLDPKDKKELGKLAQTYDEAEAGAWVKLEKELHNQYIGFLNRRELEFVHAPTHKKSELPEGWPDFTVFGPRERTLLVEFKVGKNTLSVSQALRNDRLRNLGYTVLLLRNYESAVLETRSFFNI